MPKFYCSIATYFPLSRQSQNNRGRTHTGQLDLGILRSIEEIHRKATTSRYILQIGYGTRKDAAIGAPGSGRRKPPGQCLESRNTGTVLQAFQIGAGKRWLASAYFEMVPYGGHALGYELCPRAELAETIILKHFSNMRSMTEFQ